MTKTYPSLYSKDSLGNIREWFCEVEGNRFRAVAGIHGGAMVRAEDTLAKSKNVGRANETSPEQQAILEVEALYKKKLKTKYFDTIEGAQGEGKKFFEPMLAKEYEDYKDKITYPVLVQCKYNGNRLILTKNGAFTRKGERYLAIPHIEEGFKLFFDQYPDAVLDGELFNEELREKLNELAKLVRRTVNITQEHLDKSKALVLFYVYDGFGCGASREDSYEVRQAAINKALKDIEYFREVKTWEVNTYAMAMEISKKLVAEGQEGIMIRLKNHPYKNGRAKQLLKKKPYDDDECTILKIHEGTGNWAGKAKTATVISNGITFDVSFKGSMEELAEVFLKKENYEGLENVTYIFNGFTGLGTPNYGTIDLRNCFKL